MYEDSLLRVDMLQLHEVPGLICANRNGAAVNGAEVLPNLLERCKAKGSSATLHFRPL